jgi:hypothetical protein
VVGFGSDPNNRHITTYFRREFFVTNAVNYSNLVLRLRRDDGAVVYLNGVEVQRVNMPSGPVSYVTRASLAGDDGTSFSQTTAGGGLLAEGRNLLTVEIHQNLPTSDDISFDLQLQGVAKPSNQPPLVALISPANQASFLAPLSVALEAAATDADGGIAKVEFFAGDTKLGEATSIPYGVVWNAPPLGRHLLHATAVDDLDTAVRSAEIAITIYDSAGTPFTQITTPADGTVVEGPIALLVAAEASALDGVTNVQFLANGSIIGDDPIGPYSFLWNAPFGSNSLMAVASDVNGRLGTSTVVNVTITLPPTNTRRGR